MQPGVRLAFGPFELDPARRRLTSRGEPVAVSERHLEILLALLASPGQIITKDDLIRAAWKDVAVGDNSLEQAISSLRRLLGAHHIETVPRRGYRFGVAVERRAARESDDALDALLAPHRAFVEGRAALETFDAGHIAEARRRFEQALATVPEYASAHLGLANACVMQFEMTRADPTPDVHLLPIAVEHAREACRLDPESGEAWSTLGFALDRTGHHGEALAAVNRAITLEPGNWRHHFRLAYVAWGEQRLRAAHRTLLLLPGFPLACWLAATVHVARQVLSDAERDLTAGLIGGGEPGRFKPVALHWLLGLIHLSRQDERRAADEFELELAAEREGHLYARETAANTWYAIGALRLRQGRLGDARDAFESALARVAGHAMARVGLIAAGVPGPAESRPGDGTGDRAILEAALADAARRVLAGGHAEAADLIDKALAAQSPGSAGWVLPIEPLLQVSSHPNAWIRPLARLRNRAA